MVVMSIISFFRPQTLERSKSSFSGEIVVIEEFGKKRMEIGGMIQSGGIVEKIWGKTVKNVQMFKCSNVQRVLILGLGAGTVAKVVSSSCQAVQLSSCKLTGIEIDPEVIRLGKKYFGLGKIENLEIVVDDAARYVDERFKRFKRFDLILVDLFQGREIPKNCQDKKFLKSLKKIKTDEGLIIFNRFYSKEKRNETDKFVQKCETVFNSVKTKKAICNLMVFCQ